MIKINFSKIKQSRFYIIIVLITFIIYGNSINNEYSLDDNIVVDGVAKVNEGIKGISEIFTTHYAIDKKQNYGYRPLVLVTFALEKQFFKGLPNKQTLKEKKRKDKLTQANISHLINVLLYAFTCIVLFKLLLLLLKDYNILLPLLITVIFVVHPLHTEPVANIKSRDELLMLLGTLLALIHFLKYSFTSKYKYLVYASLFVLMAFLSKKSAMALFGLIPVVLYFAKASFKKILICTFLIVCFAFVVLGMQKGLLTTPKVRDIKYFENPLLYQGTFIDRIAMGLYCSWFYLKMLIFPKDMAYYYGYNYIPLVNWSYYQVWLALIFYVPLGVYGFWRFIKRDVFGLGVVLWLGLMLAFINILFPIVGIVADRFTYLFSIGFCIVVGFLLMKIFKIDLNKDTFQLKLSSGFLITTAIVLVSYSGRVIARNPDWHDYLTTYYHDVEVVDESAKAHAMISNTLYSIVVRNPQNTTNKANINEIIKHYKRALQIDSTYLTCISNLGSAYISMVGDYQQGIYYCSKAVKMDANYLEANLNLAIAYERTNQPDSALKYYLRVVEINPDYKYVYNVLNNLLSKFNQVDKGIQMLDEIAKKSKAPKNIYMDIANLYSLDNTKLNLSLTYFIKAFEQDNTDKILCNHIVKLYNIIGDTEKANQYSKICNS